MKTGTKSIATVLFCLILMAVALSLRAGTTYSTGTSHRFYVGTVPASTESAVGGTVYLEHILFVNDSSSDVTVTVTDGDGNLLTPNGVTISAKTVYSLPFGSQICPNGIKWSASDGTNVTGRVHYRTSLATP